VTNPSDDKLITPGRSVGVLAASGWAAVSTIIVTAVASRALGKSDYTYFLVYWSVLFGCFQILTGLQNEAVRAVGEAAAGGSEPPSRQPAKVLVMALLLAAALAVVVMCTAPLWMPRLAVGPVILVVCAVSVVAYGGHLTMSGILAGRHQWGTMAALNALEPTVRVILVVVAALLVPRLATLQAAAAVSALAWVLFALVVSTGRSATSARGDQPLNRLMANAGWAMLAAAASAVLVNGFPAIVSVALGKDTPGLAALLLGVQLTRAPLMMPLAAFQGVAIAGFVASRQGRLRALIKPFVAVLGLGVLLAGAAWLLGPWLMHMIWGEQYVLHGAVLGGLTFAAVSLALLTLTGTATIAIGEHRAFLVGWLVGAGAAVGLLFWVPAADAVRVIIAVMAGPLAGVIVHLLAIRAHERQAG